MVDLILLDATRNTVTYTVMNKETKDILGFSVVYAKTVSNRSHMKKQGLIDSLESIEKDSLFVKH